jgi:single-strand DNA-binding protein
MKNKVNLIGRLGKDATTKDVKDNSSVTTFSIATEEKYKEKGSTELKTVTEWHDIELWNKKKLGSILKKGMLLDIEGKLHHDSYKKGEVTIKTTVVRAEDVIILSKKEEATE